MRAARDPTQAPPHSHIPLTSIPPTPPPQTPPPKEQEMEWDHMSVSQDPHAPQPAQAPPTDKLDATAEAKEQTTTHPLKNQEDDKKTPLNKKRTSKVKATVHKP